MPACNENVALRYVMQGTCAIGDIISMAHKHHEY